MPNPIPAASCCRHRPTTPIIASTISPSSTSHQRESTLLPAIRPDFQPDRILYVRISTRYRTATTRAAFQVTAYRVDSCLYQVSNGNDSFTIDDFSTETLSFGSSGSVSNVAIACGHDNEGLLAAASGLLGLSGVRFFCVCVVVVVVIMVGICGVRQ